MNQLQVVNVKMHLTLQSSMKETSHMLSQGTAVAKWGRDTVQRGLRRALRAGVVQAKTRMRSSWPYKYS